MDWTAIQDAPNDTTAPNAVFTITQWIPSEHLQYGQHQSFPISKEETESTKKVKVNKVYKRIRPKDHYLVTCLYCKQKWHQRCTFYAFMKNHQNKIHKDKEIKVYIVSFMESKISKKENGRYFTQEYQLRDKKDLHPLPPSNEEKKDEPDAPISDDEATESSLPETLNLNQLQSQTQSNSRSPSG